MSRGGRRGIACCIEAMPCGGKRVALHRAHIPALELVQEGAGVCHVGDERDLWCLCVCVV